MAKKKQKIASPFTKSELLAELAERCELSKRQVNDVLEELKDIISGHLSKSGPEKFTLPGILKISVKSVPARPAREGINPFTKEPTIFPAKPASRKVKVAALKQLKEMAE